jgi:NTP pyrophosphatase (non-canonical NTP hydrolase)
MSQLETLRSANIARQAEWCPDQIPDLSFRGNELAGETGEACNVIKKLERERHGWAGSRATLEQLDEELADVIICVDLVAQQTGIDLWPAVVAKFNATSKARGLDTLLPTGAEDPVRLAALRLVETLDDAQSFEVEAGESGEGPLVHLIRALGIKTPPNLKAWLDDSDDANEPCDRCGEHHAAGAMDDGLCPACADDAEDEES